MHRKPYLSFLFVLVLLLAACAPASPLPLAVTSAPASSSTPQPGPAPTTIVLTDDLGRSIKLAAPAPKIISLAPTITEILFAIGAGAQLIGRDQYSDYPEAAKKLTNIGGTSLSDKLNSELILSLKPDLVLASDLTPPEQIKALEDLGLTVFRLPNPTDLPGVYDNIRLVAKLSGHPGEAETLIASLQTRVQTVEDRVKNVQAKPLVFYELDGTDANAPWTSGPGTFIDALIKMAGGRNVGENLNNQWVQISLEELVKDDPDLIVLGDSTFGGNTPQLVKQRSGWQALTAVKNSKIYPLDDNIVSRSGPRLVDGLEALAKLLHPELFP